MTIEEINDVKQAFETCFFDEGCVNCPYSNLDYHMCKEKIHDEIMNALDRLKVLESPTEKEQPHLPGLESPKSWFDKKRKYENHEIVDLMEAYSEKDISFNKNLYGRTLNIFERNDIFTIEDLLNIKRSDRIRNVGPTIRAFINCLQWFAESRK